MIEDQPEIPFSKTLDSIEELIDYCKVQELGTLSVLDIIGVKINFKIDWDSFSEDKNVKFGTINIYRSIFEYDFILPQNYKLGTIKIEQSQFKGEFDLRGNNLSREFRLYRVWFEKKASFSDTHFNYNVEFIEVEFRELALFLKTIFKLKLNIEKCKFYENATFVYSEFESLSEFREVKFNKGLDLTRIKIEGKLSFYKIILNDFETVTSTSTSQTLIDLNQLNIVRISNDNKRETFRLIKQSLKNEGNTIDAIKYEALEQLTHLQYLQFKLRSLEGFKQEIANYIIFGLNWLSNKNRQSWFRGVIFTLVVSFIFFGFALVSTGEYEWGLCNFYNANFHEMSAYYFGAFDPFHKSAIITNKNMGPTFWTHLWLLIGRIFTAYGIYQTIAAFRKHR